MGYTGKSGGTIITFKPSIKEGGQYNNQSTRRGNKVESSRPTELTPKPMYKKNLCYSSISDWERGEMGLSSHVEGMLDGSIPH